jgi:predicted lipid-binding transport protein (Tim44 family)
VTPDEIGAEGFLPTSEQSTPAGWQRCAAAVCDNVEVRAAQIERWESWIGSLAPTILFGLLAGSGFILGLGLLCSLFDLAYIVLLVWARRGLVLEPSDRVAAGTSSITSVATAHS